MEKYRRFADAATGINPFVANVGIGSGSGVVAASTGGIGTFNSSNATPNIIVTLLAIVFFPIRLAVIFVIALLLFVLEAVADIFRRIGLQLIIGDFLLQPLIILLSRLLLTVAAALSINRRIFPARPNPSMTIGNGAQALDDVVLTPKPGDVVMSNLVTPFDWMILQAATTLTPSLFLPSSVASGNTGGGINTTAANAWRVPNALVVFVSHKEPRLISFTPGPFQRWAVFQHILKTTTEAYLAEGDVGPSPVVDLSPLQEKAAKMGVPLVVFPEGTTSNGKSVLTCSNIITNTVNNCSANSHHSVSFSEREGKSPSSPTSVSATTYRTHLISLSFDSLVPSKIIESSNSAMRGTACFFGAGSSSPLYYLFNLSRRGSGTVATSSAANLAASLDAIVSGVLSFLYLGPLIGNQNSVRVTFVRPSQVPVSTVSISAQMASPTGSPHSPAGMVSQAWMNEVRGKLCASVSFGNPNVVCKPVAVGIAEKRAYSVYVKQESNTSGGDQSTSAATATAAQSSQNNHRPGKVNPVMRSTATNKWA